jgi:hypothetical protein
MPVNKINIRENRRGNQEQTIYRQYWSQDKVQRQTKGKTQHKKKSNTDTIKKSYFCFYRIIISLSDSVQLYQNLNQLYAYHH